MENAEGAAFSANGGGTFYFDIAVAESQHQIFCGRKESLYSESFESMDATVTNHFLLQWLGSSVRRRSLSAVNCY